MVLFACTRDTFIPVDTTRVRWLIKDVDYELARDYWRKRHSPLSYKDWATAHTVGYQYAAILDQGQVISCAGVWRFSEPAWEVAAVSTLEPYRHKGHGKQVVAYVTAHILEANRLATCSTGNENTAMIATAKSVGFQLIPQEQVWWKYPWESSPDVV